MALEYNIPDTDQCSCIFALVLTFTAFYGMATVFRKQYSAFPLITLLSFLQKVKLSVRRAHHLVFCKTIVWTHLSKACPLRLVSGCSRLPFIVITILIVKVLHLSQRILINLNGAYVHKISKVPFHFFSGILDILWT